MSAALYTLIRAFWGMCTLRLAPQDVPRSGVLLIATSIINVLCSVLINRLQLPTALAVTAAALEMTVLVGLTATLLFAFHRSARLPQTLTALMGTGAVIGSLVLALMLLFPQLPPLLRFAIFVWNLLVMGHILRHALNVHLAAGFFIAVGYAIVLVQLIWFVDRLLAGSA